MATYLLKSLFISITSEICSAHLAEHIFMIVTYRTKRNSILEKYYKLVLQSVLDITIMKMCSARWAKQISEENEMKRLFNRHVAMNSLAPVTREYFFSYVK